MPEISNYYIINMGDSEIVCAVKDVESGVRVLGSNSVYEYFDNVEVPHYLILNANGSHDIMNARRFWRGAEEISDEAINIIDNLYKRVGRNIAYDDIPVADRNYLIKTALSCVTEERIPVDNFYVYVTGDVDSNEKPLVFIGAKPVEDKTGNTGLSLYFVVHRGGIVSHFFNEASVCVDTVVG